MGTCSLSNLDLACDKLNDAFLRTEPFSLIKGHINTFQLKIPWTRILQESIEIRIDGIELWLIMEDCTEERLRSPQPPEPNPLDETLPEELYDTKVDVFKKIVNKILLNMTIDVTRIKVRLFKNMKDLKRYESMEDVSFSDEAHPGILMKIGRFSVKKKKTEANLLKSSCFFLDEIEDYFIDLWEVSLHLIEDPSEEKPGLYSNVSLKGKETFPYPSISYPGTLMVVSGGCSIHIQKKKLSDEVVRLNVEIGAIEFSLDPIEIGVLSDFGEKLAGYIERKKELTKDVVSVKEEVPLQRNRSLSHIEKTPSSEGKEAKITRKLSNTNTKPMETTNSNNTPNTLNTSIRLLKEPSTAKPKAQSIEPKTDLLGVIIYDYLKKENNNPEFTIQLFEKPNISQMSPNPKPQETSKKQPINPPPIAISEEQLFLNQAEVFLANKKPNPQHHFKFDLSLKKLSFVLLGSPRNHHHQDQFARPWLFSIDPYLQNQNSMGSEQKKQLKYNIQLPSDSMQALITEISLRSRSQNEIKGTVGKLKVFLVKMQEDSNLERSLIGDDSEIFQSAQSSINMSFLQPRKIERKLVFFKRKHPVFIKEVLRVSHNKAKPKFLMKDAIKSQGALIERPVGLMFFGEASKQRPDFSVSFSFKPNEKGLEIKTSPIFISLDLFKLSFLINFMSLIPRASTNLRESTLNINLNKSVSMSRHIPHRKPEKSQEISINVSCDRLSIDFEDWNLIIQEPILSKPPLFGFVKTSFTSVSLSLVKRTLQSPDVDCFPLVIVDTEETLSRRNSVFFETESNSNERSLDEENKEFAEGKYQEIIAKKNKFGVFIANMKVFGYLDCLWALNQSLRGFQSKFEKFSMILEQKPQEPQKSQLAFSILLDKISLYLNSDQIKPNIFEIQSFRLRDYTPSEDSLSKSILLRLVQSQIFAMPNNHHYSIAIEDLILIDHQTQKVALDCPLKLVQGSDCQDRRKTLGVFNDRLKDVERLEGVLVYKQGVFQSNRNSENIEFFRDFRTLSSQTAGFKAKISNNGAKIQLELKGLVVKMGVLSQFLKSRIEKLIGVFENKAEEVKGEKQVLTRKYNYLDMNLSINDAVLDCFPHYTPKDVLNNPELFNFKMTDLDPKKQGNFYFNTRSAVLLNGFKLELTLGDSGIEKLDLKLEKIKACLLQFFDFDVWTNPLIFSENSKELGVFYDTLLENMGFMPILEVTQIECVLKPSKSLVLGLISLDSCSDSLKILNRHIASVLLCLSNEKLVANRLEKLNDKNLKEKLPSEKKSTIKKKDSFIVIDEQELMEEESNEKEAQDTILRFRSTIAQGFLHCFQKPKEILIDSFKLSINSLNVNLYDGSDFDFLIRDKAFEQQEVQSKAEEKHEKTMELVIVEDYFTNDNLKKQAKVSTKKQEPSYRKRNKIRCLQRHVSIQCEDAILSYFEFEESRFKLAFSIESFEITDNINNSNIKKIVIEDRSKDPELEKEEFLSLEIVGDKKARDAHICLKSGDLKLFFNGVNLEFLIGFFGADGNREVEELYWMNEYYGQNERNKGGEKSVDFFASHPNLYSWDKKHENSDEEGPEKDSEIKIGLIYVEEFQLTVDYDANFCNLNKVLENKLNLINIGNINSLRLLFKQIHLREESLGPELLLKILDTYKNDIILNQKPNILKKLPYINNLFNVLEGFGNIFYIPYRAAIQGGSIERGVLQGIGSFAKAVSIESLNFTELLAKGLGIGLSQLGVERKKKGRFFDGVLERVRGKIDPNEQEKKGEKYKN